MSTLHLRGPHITLAQALKVAGFISSGGQAKHLIREGKAKVNGALETRPGRKLVEGDRFQFEAGPEWQVSATPEEA